MLVLLPPSETKRDGGDLGVLEFGRLSFRGLDPLRAELVGELEALADAPEQMMRALKLGPRQTAEVDRNAALRSAPTMPVIDRYTGVLYDALDAPSLDDSARAYAGRTVAVHSALFGLVGALDPIPAYRLSHDSRLPGRRLRDHWRSAVAEELAAHPGVILDLRSEGYVGLGPAPARDSSLYVRVVAEGEDGRKRALNHFNKRAKGLLTRALVQDRPRIDSVDALFAWARAAGFRLEPVEPSGSTAGTESRVVELVA